VTTISNVAQTLSNIVASPNTQCYLINNPNLSTLNSQLVLLLLKVSAAVPDQNALKQATTSLNAYAQRVYSSGTTTSVYAVPICFMNLRWVESQQSRQWHRGDLPAAIA